VSSFEESGDAPKTTA
jgi:serine/threonine protein kinase